jgi:hypothetical protein
MDQEFDAPEISPLIVIAIVFSSPSLLANGNGDGHTNVL